MKIKKIVVKLIMLNVVLVIGMTGIMMFGVFAPDVSYGFQDEYDEVVAESKFQEPSANVRAWMYLAAALSTGLSCIAGGIAVSGVGSAAMGALSEKPDLVGRALIFVGLAEGVCIYGLIISIMILGKI